MASFQSVAVIGAGAWGTALAGVAARAGREVVLCARSPAIAAEIAATRTNPKLPGSKLEANVKVTDDISLAAAAELILIATPAQSLRAAVSALAPHLASATPIIACAKGIERGTHKFMTEVIAEAAPHARPAILSGPSFAEDVVRGLPTAVTLAANDVELASHLVQALGSATFRPYHPSDVRGVDHARLFRVGAARAGLWRAQRNHGGAVRSRRFDPDLLEPAIAQFRPRPRARARPGTAARQARRRRIHRTGADR